MGMHIPNIVILFVTLALAITASAQTDVATASSGPVFRASFGFAGKVTVGRWVPVRIDVTGGSEFAEGTVIVTAGSGVATSMRAAREWVATPNRTARVEIPMLLPTRPPYSDDEIFFSIVVLDDRGTILHREEYSTAPRGTRMSMGVPFTPEVTTILDVDLRLHIPSANLLQVSPVVLPRSAMLYDSVTVVMLRSESIPALNSEQIAALREWIAGGGTLIIQSNPLSSHLSRLLPPDMLSHSDASSGIAGFMLTDSAINHAWRTLSVNEGQAKTSLECLYGPLGLGQVLIYDRTDVLALNPERHGQLLLATLKNLEVSILSDEEVAQSGWGYSGAWASSPGLDALASEFEIGLALWWIPLLVFTIAIILGLLDRLVMKRLNLLHRSWHSAMMWLLLFGVIAYSIPHWMRSGETEALAFLISDHTSDGVDFRTIIAGVSAGESRVLRLGTSDDAVQTWDRPVYAVDWSSSRSLSPRLDFLPERGARADTFPIALWTFNAIIRQETMLPSLQASGMIESDGAILVTVTGFPESEIRRSAIRLPGGEAYEISFTRHPDGTLKGSVPADRERSLSLWRGIQLDNDSFDHSMIRHGIRQNDELLMTALTLPDTHQRSRAFRRAGRLHNMSTLYIEIADTTSTYPFLDLPTPTRTLYRIATPHHAAHDDAIGSQAP